MTGGITTILAGSVARAPWGWALLFLAFIYLVKQWPVINEQVADAKMRLRAAKREVQKEEKDDLRQMVEDLQVTVKEQAAKIELLQGESTSNQMKLVSALAAFRLLAGEVAKNDPNNPVLKQATDLIGMAATGDMGMGKVMDELSRLPASHGKGAK